MQQPGGAIALVPSIGGTVAIEWFAKSHEVYGSVLGDKAGSDDAHYLNLTKTAGEGVLLHIFIAVAALLANNANMPRTHALFAWCDVFRVPMLIRTPLMTSHHNCCFQQSLQTQIYSD